MNNPLPPMHQGDITDIWDSAKNNTALRARIKALHKYARHSYPGCFAEEEFRCDCGLADLVADLEREGLVP